MILSEVTVPFEGAIYTSDCHCTWLIRRNFQKLSPISVLSSSLRLSCHVVSEKGFSDTWPPIRCSPTASLTSAGSVGHAWPILSRLVHEAFRDLYNNLRLVNQVFHRRVALLSSAHMLISFKTNDFMAWNKVKKASVFIYARCGSRGSNRCWDALLVIFHMLLSSSWIV